MAVLADAARADMAASSRPAYVTPGGGRDITFTTIGRAGGLGRSECDAQIPAGSPDCGFEPAEASATLDRLLNTLPERDQLALLLRFGVTAGSPVFPVSLGLDFTAYSRAQQSRCGQRVSVVCA